MVPLTLCISIIAVRRSKLLYMLQVFLQSHMWINKLRFQHLPWTIMQTSSHRDKLLGKAEMLSMLVSPFNSISITTTHWCSQTGPGHLISVGMVYSLPVVPGPGGHVAKGLVKQKPKTKMTNVILNKIICTNFIKAFLTTHNLSEKYSPGVHSGPDFKLWWLGLPYVLFLVPKVVFSFICSGVKSGAATIQTDNNFCVALEHLLSKPKAKCTVSVKFD